MLRGPLHEEGYRPQLSGHETFPLRYGWLKKAFDAVRETEPDRNEHDHNEHDRHDCDNRDCATRDRATRDRDNRTVFTDEDAIARFGVGKNMVASMRHWATAAGVVEESGGRNRLATTPIGRRLFNDDGGLDPYMENPATSWLVHWHLCGRPIKTTWFWAFNYYSYSAFERETLVEQIGRLARDRHWSHASAATIKNDVTCFVRTYVAQLPSRRSAYEDGLESPLTELGLIKPVGRHGGFRFVRGQKPSLGVGVFGYAVSDFWRRSANTQTLSFAALAHEPGSPGRVFLLEENDVVDLLHRLENASGGVYHWSETAGLKQLSRTRELSPQDAVALLETDYAPDRKQRRRGDA